MKIQTGIILILLLVFAVIIISSGVAQQPGATSDLPVSSEASDRSYLIFLGNENIAPVVYLDGSTPSGVAVDIVRALVKHIPEPVEIRAMNWSEAQNLVLQEKADALIQINPTEERKKLYEFSDTLLESQFSIFTRSDTMGISDASTLRGLKVGVESGGLPQKVLEKDPLIRLTIIPDFVQGFRGLDEGSTDAVVVDYRVGSYILAENNIQNIKVTGKPVVSSYSSIAVKKGNVKLLQEINTALSTIKNDGTYQKILEDWRPTEGIFQTKEQITERLFFTAILILVILFLFAGIWIVTIRKELVKRRSAEEKIQAQYSTLHSIINSVQGPLYSVDTAYRYTSFNQRHAEMMKVMYNADIRLDSVILDHISMPGERVAAKDNLDMALAGNQVVVDAFFGEESPSRQIFQVFYNPVKGDEGIIGVAVFSLDITERRRSEEERGRRHEELNRAYEKLTNHEKVLRDNYEKLQKTEALLRQSEHKFRSILDQTFQFIGLLSLDGILLVGNRSAMEFAGIEESGVIGRAFWETPWWNHDPVLQEKLKDGIRKAAAGETVRFEATHPIAGGDLAIIDFSIKPMLDEDGEIIFLIPEGRDITERKRAEDEVMKLTAELEKRVIDRTIELDKTQEAYRKANEKLNLLNSITRHDINNQLTILTGYLEILMGEVSDPPATAMLQKAQHSCRVILNQIEFTKNYQDIGVKSPRWQNVEVIIRKVMDVLPHEKILFRIQLNNLEVYADPLLEKVVYNLVDNAIRYGEKITEIRFSFEKVSEGILIICEDDGYGISDDDKKLLFSKGFGKNTGLGLYLSREILGITGCTIKETGIAGKGARFEILVPKEQFRFFGEREDRSAAVDVY